MHGAAPLQPAGDNSSIVSLSPDDWGYYHRCFAPVLYHVYLPSPTYTISWWGSLLVWLREALALAPTRTPAQLHDRLRAPLCPHPYVEALVQSLVQSPATSGHNCGRYHGYRSILLYHHLPTIDCYSLCDWLHSRTQ